MYRRSIQFHERCSVCHLTYQRNYGDTWFFMIITDRLPIFAGIVLVFFGFRSTDWRVATAFTIAMIVPLLLTMRERQGVALSLDYLSRIYLPDPSDEIHSGPAPAGRSHARDVDSGIRELGTKRESGPNS